MLPLKAKNDKKRLNRVELKRGWSAYDTHAYTVELIEYLSWTAEAGHSSWSLRRQVCECHLCICFSDLQTHKKWYYYQINNIQTPYNNTRNGWKTLRRCARIDSIAWISATNQLSTIPVTSHWQHLVAIFLLWPGKGTDPPCIPLPCHSPIPQPEHQFEFNEFNGKFHCHLCVLT